MWSQQRAASHGRQRSSSQGLSSADAAAGKAAGGAQGRTTKSHKLSSRGIFIEVFLTKKSQISISKVDFC